SGANFDLLKLLDDPWGWRTTTFAIGGGSAPNSGVPADYVTASLVTTTGHTGATTRAMKLDSPQKNPNDCCQQAFIESIPNGYPRIGGHVEKTKDVYARYWTRFNPEMATQAASQGTGYWRDLFAFKSWTDYRIAIGIDNYHLGGPSWYVQADGCGWQATSCGAPPIYWRWEQDVKVPLDQWFYVE